jgi:hypothetical protein
VRVVGVSVRTWDSEVAEAGREGIEQQARSSKRFTREQVAQHK